MAIQTFECMAVFVRLGGGTAPLPQIHGHFFIDVSCPTAPYPRRLPTSLSQTIRDHPARRRLPSYTN